MTAPRVEDFSCRCDVCGKVSAIGGIHTCSPQVTAPTPERRVGEAVELHLSGVRYVRTAHGDWLNAVYPECAVLTTTREALDKIARLTAEVERLEADRSKWIEAVGLLSTLDGTMMVNVEDPVGMARQVHAKVTAEVERLRGIATDAVGWLDSRYHSGRVDAQARFRAALSLPTPAPEATE